MLIAVPAFDQSYYRPGLLKGMGGLLSALRSRGLGQDDSSSFDYTQANNIGPVAGTYSGSAPIAEQIPTPPDVGSIFSEGVAPPNDSTLFPSSATLPAGSIVTPTGSVAATIGPGGTVQPAAGYSVNAQGQVVPSSLASFLSGSTFGVQNSTLLLGAGGVLVLAALLKKKRRR